MLKELKEFERKYYIIVILMILAIVSPGFLCLMHYKPALISSLDIFKILIASVSLTLPFFFLNLFFTAFIMYFKFDKPKADQFFIIWGVSAFVTAVVLYSSLYVAYLRHYTFLELTYVELVLEVLIAGVCILEGYILYRRKNVRISNKVSETDSNPTQK